MNLIRRFSQLVVVISLFYFYFVVFSWTLPAAPSGQSQPTPPNEAAAAALDSSAPSFEWRSCVDMVYPGFAPVDSFASDNDDERPILVYLWHSLHNFLFIDEPSVRACDVPCVFVDEWREDMPECVQLADAYLFNPPMQTSARAFFPSHERRRDAQAFVLFLTEAEEQWPMTRDATYLAHFDLNMTYHLAADVPFSYFISLDMYTKMLPLTWPKTATAPVAMFMSNCDKQWVKSERMRYIHELMADIDVHSYGTCFQNRRWPAATAGMPWWEAKWNVSARYKFTLAFENAVADDYVTEKLYHAFIAGTVPVYMGAPNVKRFAPTPRAVIDTRDFSSAAELAAYLRFLNENDDAYAELLAWRRGDEPLQVSFLALERTSPRTAPCRLCKALHERRMRRRRSSSKSSSGDVGVKIELD